MRSRWPGRLWSSRFSTPFCCSNGRLHSALIVANRLLDGLDGAVARIRGPSLWGGYLDSLCDYLFYVAVPVGFAFAAPANELSALLLLASFTSDRSQLPRAGCNIGGPRFGAWRQSLQLLDRIDGRWRNHRFFLAMCLFPALFPQLGLVFAGLCLLTVAQRLWMARKLLKA